jgi:tetratricopeptide (TPR) repeat protein
MKIFEPTKISPWAVAIISIGIQLPTPALPIKSTGKSQTSATATLAISQARDKYGFPSTQISNLLKAKDFTGLQALVKTIPRRPGDEERRQMLDGAILCQNSNFEAALPIFKKVQHSEVATSFELSLASKAFALSQNFQKSISLASIGIERDNDQKCLEMRATAYSNLNRFVEAAQDFETLAKTQPLWASDYLCKEADVLARLHKDREALNVAERAEKANPYDAGPPFAKGLCLVKLDRQNEAVQAFTKCIQNAKNQLRTKSEASFILTNAFRERAKCYRALGKIREAEADKAEQAKTSDKLMDDLIGK